MKTARMILSAALVIATVGLLIYSLHNSSGATFLTSAQRIGVFAGDFPESAPTSEGNRSSDFTDGNPHAKESAVQALLGLGMIAISGISMRARRHRDS